MVIMEDMKNMVNMVTTVNNRLKVHPVVWDGLYFLFKKFRFNRAKMLLGNFVRILPVLLILGIVLTGCGDSFESAESTEKIFAMDTYMTVTAYGEGALEAVSEAKNIITQYDNMLSVTDKNSLIYTLNTKGVGDVSKELIYMIDYSKKIHSMTDGAFDITTYPLKQLWGFGSDEYNVPDDEAISKCKNFLGMDSILVDHEKSKISYEIDGMKIDMGGIAKGYVSDEIINHWRKSEIKSGIINLGGNVFCLGHKTDGSLWNVAIENPDNSTIDGAYLGTVSVSDKAVITSGAYERYFKKNGKIYHHIIDPTTGRPSDSGLLSVSVISENATLADGLSTAFYILGIDKTINIWQSNRALFDFVICDDAGDVYVSNGIADNFKSEQKVIIVDEERTK